MDLTWLFLLAKDFVAPGELFCIFLIISLTVNLEFGYTGIPNFGKVLFVTVGAFVAGSLSFRLMVYLFGLKGDPITYQALFIPQIDARLAHDPLMAVGVALMVLAIGAGLGGLVGFLASYPAIRLREDYLGMLLLASGEFFNYFSLAYYPFLGGGQGVTVPDPVFDLGKVAGVGGFVVLGVLIASATIVFLFAERVGRSPLGRTLRAVRDNEIASEALGKDNVVLRRNVLVVASMIAGIAGVLYLFYQPYIEPGPTGGFTRQIFTFIPFVIVILGGASNNFGVLLGTAVYVVILESFSQVTTYALSQGINFPVDPNRIQPILIGVLLILILMRRPQGLIPEKATLTMSMDKLKKIGETSAGKGKAGGQQAETAPGESYSDTKPSG